MQIADDHPVLVTVIADDCKECDFMKPLLELVAAENEEIGLELVNVDAWEDPGAVVELEALLHPTSVLFVNGTETARLAGASTKRQLLRKFLPCLYLDPDEALRQLRAQLDNPGEKFPSRRFALRAPRSDDKIATLGRIPLLATMSKRQLASIARYTDTMTAENGQILAREGEDGDQLYVICEGSAVVSKDGQEIAKLGAGEFFGEMALIDGEPRSATVEVSEDSLLLTIHRREFDFLVDSVDGMARQLLTVVTRRLREADRRLVD